MLAHARRLEALDEGLRAFLGAPLQRHCRLANLRDGILVVHADSPAWSTRLRYQERQILAYMRRAAEPTVRRLVVRVKPPAIPSPRQAPARPLLSNRSAALLRSVAADIGDERLEKLLVHLAGRSG